MFEKNVLFCRNFRRWKRGDKFLRKEIKIKSKLPNGKMCAIIADMKTAFDKKKHGKNCNKHTKGTDKENKRQYNIIKENVRIE